MYKSLIASALLAASTSLFAQATPPADSGNAPGKAPRHHRVDCSKEKDPAACEQRRKEMREKMKSARSKAGDACKGKEGAERRACVGQQLCAQSKDPAKCEARIKARAERHKQRQEHKAQQPEKK